MIKRVLFALTVTGFFYWIVMSRYKNYTVEGVMFDMIFLLIIYWLSIGCTYAVVPLKKEEKE